jgi:hypothetical protein
MGVLNTELHRYKYIGEWVIWRGDKMLLQWKNGCEENDKGY